MTGYRIAYACGPAKIIDAMMKIHQYSMLCAPINGQEAALEALKNGKGEMMLMRDEYRDRRNIITNRLNSMGLKCFKPRGAFYVFPNITSTGMTSMEFATKLLEEKNVAVVPGTAFGECGEGFVRCAYAASIDNIIEAMNRINDFIN
jgi:aminotransferase